MEESCRNIDTLKDSGFRSEDNEEVDKNRHILSQIIDCVKISGVVEFASCGHDENEHSEDPSVFRGPVDFVGSLDAAAQEHLQNAAVFKGTSETVQKQESMSLKKSEVLTLSKVILVIFQAVLLVIDDSK